MKILVPTNDGVNVAEHFGRCESYMVLNEKSQITGEIKNTSEHMGGKGLPPELMRDNKANVLLCKDLGMRALSLCNEYGIKVYTSQSKTIKEIFDLWKKGKLKEACQENACSHGEH